MKNDLPSKIKRGKPTFIRIKANKKEMKYNNDNVRRQDRLLEEDRAYALLREGEYGVLSMTTPTGGVYGIPLNFVWDGQENIYIHCAPRGRKSHSTVRKSSGYTWRSSVENANGYDKGEGCAFPLSYSKDIFLNSSRFVSSGRIRSNRTNSPLLTAVLGLKSPDAI